MKGCRGFPRLYKAERIRTSRSRLAGSHLQLTLPISFTSILHISSQPQVHLHYKDCIMLNIFSSPAICAGIVLSILPHLATSLPTSPGALAPRAYVQPLLLPYLSLLLNPTS